jgi:hypothetical protein
MTASASLRTYIGQLRAFDDEELDEEAYYLAAALPEPSRKTDAPTRYQRMEFVGSEQASRAGDVDAVHPGPCEWTLP